FGVAENQEIGGVEAQGRRGSAGGMIDVGEFGQALALNFGLEPVHRFHRPVAAGYGYQSLCGPGACPPFRQSFQLREVRSGIRNGESWTAVSIGATALM